MVGVKLAGNNSAGDANGFVPTGLPYKLSALLALKRCPSKMADDCVLTTMRAFDGFPVLSGSFELCDADAFRTWW